MPGLIGTDLPRPEDTSARQYNLRAVAEEPLIALLLAIVDDARLEQVLQRDTHLGLRRGKPVLDIATRLQVGTEVNLLHGSKEL